MTAAGIHESPPAPAPASPAFAVAGARLVWLYLVSRRVPAAAGLLAALGCLLWAALHWHLNIAGGPAAQLVIAGDRDRSRRDRRRVQPRPVR